MPTRRPRRRSPLALAALLAPLVLTACASADVGPLTRTVAPPHPPSYILVETAFVPDSDPDVEAAKARAAQEIRKDLIHRLDRAGFEAASMDAVHVPTDAAVLQVVVLDIDRGSRLQRMLLGFGAGQIEINARVRFLPDAETPAQMQMQTQARSGRRPGLIAPLGVAVAAGGSLGLAPAGLAAVSEYRGGLDGVVGRMDQAIMKQLKAAYAVAGWRWPADRQPPA